MAASPDPCYFFGRPPALRPRPLESLLSSLPIIDLRHEEGLNEGQRIAGRIQRWETGSVQGPYTMEVYPTMACNIDCVFCDTTYRKGKQADEMTTEEYEQAIEEAVALGVRRIFILGGGEPLVAKGTRRIMRRVKQAGVEGVIGTNGTLFDEELIQQVLDTQWDEIHFSLDAPFEREADYLRGKPGAFRKAIQTMCRIHGLKQQRKLAFPRMLIHYVVTNKNYWMLEDMVRQAHAVGCFRVNFDYIISYRPEQHALNLSDEERAEVPFYAERGLRAAEALGMETTLDHFLEQKTMDRGNMDFDLTGPKTVADAPCLNPWYYLVVQPNGAVSPCCVITGHGEDIRKDGLTRIWEEGEYFSSLRANMKEKVMTDLCRNCTRAITSRNDYIREYL